MWAFLASSQKELAQREARLAALEASGATSVDVDAITEAVASRIAERLLGPQ